LKAVSNGDATKSIPKKRGRWDQTTDDSAPVSKKKGSTTPNSSWDQAESVSYNGYRNESNELTTCLLSQQTPAHSRWDETPGHEKGAQTPGATPGQSTRMWDATPGHATPGHATPGHTTPGHDKASARRNRWDETPKTERGISCII
jgi:splicing factor 3B subunit 1